MDDGGIGDGGVEMEMEHVRELARLQLHRTEQDGRQAPVLCRRTGMPRQCLRGCTYMSVTSLLTKVGTFVNLSSWQLSPSSDHEEQDDDVHCTSIAVLVPIGVATRSAAHWLKGTAVPSLPSPQ